MSEQPQNKVDLRITPEFAAQAGKGRPKGVPNKMTKALKEMILEALENKGGVEYLEKQADENPAAFMTLIGKILPTQLTGEDGGAIKFADVTEDIAAVNAMLGELARRHSDGPSIQ